MGFVGTFAATLGLVLLALAPAARAANVQSTSMAGYNFANYIGVPGAVNATIVVPRLNCRATPSGSAIYVGVGIQSVSSYARLYLACTPRGAARYYPSLVVNGSIRNFAADAARTGDTIELAVSQSASQVTDSVVDVTHRFIASGNGGGSGTSEGILAGDFPATSGTTTAAVPSFGKLAFSDALINGYPFGSSGTGLQTDNLYASSTLQVKTTLSGRNKESFVTEFVHS